MAGALELRHVLAGYGETVVLEDINLALAPGESISVIGRVMNLMFMRECAIVFKTP
jgi:ABC-type branched-subunit amino acid transport system ATPase component